MPKEKLESWVVNSGRTNWGPRRPVGNSWYMEGTYVSPNGMCEIVTEPRYTIIHTVVDGIEYKLTIQGFVTQLGASKRCGNLLRKIKHNTIET